MAELTESQRRELHAAGDEPLRLTDPDSNREYVILPAEIYDRLKEQRADNIEHEFRMLVSEWKSGRRPTSSAVRMANHPAYQRIIELGRAHPDKVVPLLLAEPERSPDHWFIALHEITDEDPVPAEVRGNLKEMAAAWVQWGKSHELSR